MNKGRGGLHAGIPFIEGFSRFHGVQWHGYQSQLLNSVTPNYHRNVINAFATAPAFANTFSNPGGGRLIVAGHSLGNILISSAIQDHGLAPHSFFMLNAAVAQEAYDTRDIVLTENMMHSGTAKGVSPRFHDFLLTWRV